MQLVYLFLKVLHQYVVMVVILGLGRYSIFIAVQVDIHQFIKLSSCIRLSFNWLALADLV